MISISFSFFNAAANFAAGGLSDFLNSRKILSRERFISVYFVGCALVLLTLALMLWVQPSGKEWNMLFGLLMVSVGFGWGLSFTLFPTVTSEVYGPRNFGACYSFVNLGSLIATVVVPNLDAWVSQHGPVCTFHPPFRSLSFLGLTWE